LPLAKDIDDFDFAGTPVNQSLVRELVAGTFVAGYRNVVLVGSTGTGKSHLAIAIARALIPKARAAASSTSLISSIGSKRKRITASRGG